MNHGRARRLSALTRLAQLRVDEQRLEQAEQRRATDHHRERRDQSMAAVDESSQRLRGSYQRAGDLKIQDVDWLQGQLELQLSGLNLREGQLKEASERLQRVNQILQELMRRFQAADELLQQEKGRIKHAEQRKLEADLDDNWLMRRQSR